MAVCVLYTPQRKEGKLLLQAIHHRAAYFTGQDLDCRICQAAQEACAQLRICQTEAIIWDASQEEDLPMLLQARLVSHDAFLLILASKDTSPLSFLRPEIMPSSLILRPLGPAEVDRAACEILRAICGSKAGCFVIERKGERQQIPWDQIYYFESREKKIYVRLRGAEIGFSGTLEGLTENLPAHFRRCHRSFIVNAEKIDKVYLSKGLILLWDSISVPLSRGYKQDMKGHGNGRV